MAVWFPLLKASLPYITQLVTAAIPAFISKSTTEKDADIVPKQIAELSEGVGCKALSRFLLLFLH